MNKLILRGTSGITSDNKGNLYVADYYNHFIVKMNEDGENPKVFCKFSNDEGIFDLIYDEPRNSLIACDERNCTIQTINLETKEIKILAGVSKNSGRDVEFEEESPIESLRIAPSGIALNKITGNLYVSDNNLRCIRELNFKTGISRIIAGGNRNFDKRLSNGYSAKDTCIDGTSILYDHKNNLIYIANFIEKTIQTINLENGMVGKFAGRGFDSDRDRNLNIYNNVDHPIKFNDYYLSNSNSLTMDHSGNVYVIDGILNKIYKLSYSDQIAYPIVYDISFLRRPFCLHINNKTNMLFVTDFHNAEVWKINLRTNEITCIFQNPKVVLKDKSVNIAWKNIETINVETIVPMGGNVGYMTGGEYVTATAGFVPPDPLDVEPWYPTYQTPLGTATVAIPPGNRS